MKSDDGLDLCTRPRELQAHGAPKAKSDRAYTRCVRFGPGRQGVQGSHRPSPRLCGICVQRIQQLDCIAEVCLDQGRAVQVTGKRDIPERCQALGTFERVRIEAVGFRKDQNSGA